MAYRPTGTAAAGRANGADTNFDTDEDTATAAAAAVETTDTKPDNKLTAATTDKHRFTKSFPS